jgi:hypothetical protein
MPTHGRARQVTIARLQDREPFQRKGFSMTAVDGAVSTTGRLPQQYADQYNMAAKHGQVAYTVLSYSTPIAWVTANGNVIVPDVKYSQTTTQQQSLCRVYL